MMDENGEMPIWVTSVVDQMAAAARDGDLPGFVGTALDGWLTGFADDEAKGATIDFNTVFAAVMQLHPISAAAVAAEAVCRLYHLKGKT